MRKSALQKVYNPQNFEVTGKKIVQQPKPSSSYKSSFSNKIIKVNKEPAIKLNITKEESASYNNNQKNQKFNYQSIKNKHPIKSYVYKNVEISNKLLKELKESTKVEDFKRILQTILYHQSDDSRFNNDGQEDYLKKHYPKDKILERLEVEEIYEEFYGKYFNYLENLVNN